MKALAFIFPSKRTTISGLHVSYFQIVEADHWITSLQTRSAHSKKRQNSSLIPSFIVGSMGWGGANNVNTICL